MAQHLSNSCKRVTIWKWMVTGFVFVMSAAGAENLADPTRPPASLGASREQEAGSAVAGPALQSVLISPARRLAVIDGKTVKEGEKFGDYRVARISQDEVILRNGQDVKVLKLYPQIEKRFGSSQTRDGVQGGRQ